MTGDERDYVITTMIILTMMFFATVKAFMHLALYVNDLQQRKKKKDKDDVSS